MTTDYGQAPPAPGWFPDPTFPGQERRRDGSAWTDEVRDSARTKLVDPRELASPEQVNAAILSAEAFSELVDLAPPLAGTAHPPTIEQTMRQALAPRRPSTTRRIVSAALIVVAAGLVAALLALLVSATA